jgi:hypothetical protein
MAPKFCANKATFDWEKVAVVTQESIRELQHTPKLSKELLPWKSILDFLDMRASQA